MNEVIRCILERRSIRKFEDKPIAREELETIMEAAVNAPNGKNNQTWNFFVLTNGEKIEKLKSVIVETLGKTQTDSLQGFGNPAAVVIVTNRKNNYNSMADGSCAITNMMLAAWSLGIGACWINALRTIQEEAEIRNILGEFGVSDSHLIVGMVELGYLLEGELPKKPRRRMNAIKFVE